MPRFSCMCLINNGNSSKGKKKKNSRKIYPKFFQMNLRKRHLFYNRGGEGGRTHKWFHLQMWFIKETEDDSGRDQHYEWACAKTKRNVLFLGLEEKIFFSLMTVLTSEAEARNVNPLRASLALHFHSFHREGERRPIVCPDNREKKKTLFLTFRGQR